MTMMVCFDYYISYVFPCCIASVLELHLYGAFVRRIESHQRWQCIYIDAWTVHVGKDPDACGYISASGSASQARHSITRYRCMKFD
jgi:hypothetical protein